MSPLRIQSFLYFLLGLVLIGGGYLFFTDVVAFETQGGTLRTSTIAKTLYALGGKYLVLGTFAGIGALIAVASAYVFATGRMPRKA